MSQSVLVTIPDELVEDFINHLGRMKPDKAKHITITLLDDISHEEKMQKCRDLLDLPKKPKHHTYVPNDNDMNSLIRR